MTDRDPLWGGGGDSPDDTGVRVSVAPVNVCQVPVSADMLLLEPAQEVARKRQREFEQAVMLPAPKKLADRTVQIAGFTWTLPPDPGEDGPYPSLTFLIGAAISSSDSGVMESAEVCQWIRERYPSRPISKDKSIFSTLSKETGFVNILAGKRHIGLWQLRDPRQFRDYYKRGTFLSYRCGSALDWVRRSAQPAPGGQGSGLALLSSGASLPSQPPAPSSAEAETPLVPALSVRFGDHILTLPSYRAGQKKPTLRLRCGCAIALGSEQGSSVAEITEWIARRYSVQGADAIETLKRNVRTTLDFYCQDFRRADTQMSWRPGGGRSCIKWVLKNPADFAASYEGSA